MSSLADVLAGLQKAYLASLPEKIANIQMLFDACEFVKLETDYHKLKGTGKTYGLPEVTRIGALVERLCQLDLILLAEAVPLSTTLLANIRTARENGEAYKLEPVPAYQRLTQLVQQAEAKAG